MDKFSESISSFEELLKKQLDSKSVRLYENPVARRTQSTTLGKTYTPEDVISTVALQMKAIQSANYNVKKDRSNRKILPKCSNSHFLPVNKLPMYNEAPQPKPFIAQNFETQGFSNTQLINVIDAAEAFNTHQGMTQEFETTFAHIEGSCDNNIETNEVISEPESDCVDVAKTIEHGSPKVCDIPYITSPSNDGFCLVDISLKDKIDVKESSDDDIQDDIEPVNVHEISAIINENVTQILNESIIEEEMEDRSVIEERECKSPVFSAKIKRITTKLSTHLTVNLECFERFENAAFPIVVETHDMEATRHLINSQIINKQLNLLQSLDPELVGYDTTSPVLELNERLSVENSDEKVYSTNTEVLEDEILFSSDEEEETKYRTDEALTCAVDNTNTTIKEDLDETMFVGFQTASNKAIQVMTNSFSKAKDILDDKTEPTLTELVLKYASKEKDGKINNLKIHEGKDETKKASKEELLISKSPLKNTKDSSDNKASKIHRNEITKLPVLDSFKTASNKVIKLSEKSLSRCKKVFQDIDLNETYDTDVDTENQNKIAEEIKENPEKNEKASLNLPNTKVKNEAENLEEFKVDENILMEFANSQISFFDDDGKANSHEGVKEKCELGFKTASNKNIVISETALAKSKNIFQEIDVNEEFSDLNNFSEHTKRSNQNVGTSVSNSESESNMLSCRGLKTVSNKEIKISDQALTKSKQLFVDNNEFEVESKLKSLYPEILEDVSQPSTSNAVFVGFKTANNKHINISKEALLKSNNMFQDIDDEIYNAEPPSPIKSSIKDWDKLGRPAVNFRTVNDKSWLGASTDVLLKSSNILKDIYNTKENEKPTAFNNKSVISSVQINDYLASSSNNAQNKNEKNKFQGFLTASNKAVKISAEALAKTKNIFQDIDLIPESDYKKDEGATSQTLGVTRKNTETSLNATQDKDMPEHDHRNVSRKTEFQGFQTASKIPVTISADALAKTKNIFQDIDMSDIKNEGVETYARGFQTASNKPVKISAESLEKTKNIEEDFGITSENKSNLKIKPKFEGFQTASNKQVHVSEEAIRKSKQLLSDLEDNFTDTRSVKGFQTASDKREISKDALEKSNKLSQDIDETDCVSFFKGFQTANNAPVKISKQALAKSRKIFQEIQEIDIIESKSDEFNASPVLRASDANVRSFEGESVNKKRLFNSIDKEDIRISKETQGNFKGFQTASNKKVKISEDALAKSKHLFQDIHLDDKDESHSKEDMGSAFKGLHTASNKKVNVSEEAFLKSKQLFELDSNSKCNKDSNSKDVSSNFKGFQTANNKQVCVSDDALAKSKEMFQDFELSQGSNIMLSKIENLDEKGQNETENKLLLGFKAGKEEIKLSKETLEKYRKIFADDNDKIIHNRKESNTDANKKNEIESIVDTQVLNHFEQEMDSQDFKVTPQKTSKRSGSPILSCPKAKRRKFSTPYKTFKAPEPKKEIVDNKKELKYHFKRKKYTLKDLTKIEASISNTIKNVDLFITAVEFESLLNFEFKDNRNDMSAKTVKDIETRFFELVNPKIVPNGWFENHTQLILWKLISYEVRFPNALGMVCTAKKVLEQLLYRYKRELYDAERPVLRKILERDDAAAKTMILCVVKIFSDSVAVNGAANPSSNIELLLTDGWYCIRASLDKMLSELVCKGRIRVGCKLATQGAELLNCEQGMAPWENTSLVRLKLSGNSTRLASWDTRLGRHGRAAILCPLSAISCVGGKVGSVRALVTRVYPMLYVETHAGGAVTRSERLESIQQMKYEAERHSVMERIYEEVEKEFTDQDSQDSEGPYSGTSLESGTQIAKAMRHCKDPSEFRNNLTSSQKQTLQEHTEKKRESLLQNVQKRVQEEIEKRGLCERRVVSLLKVRIAGVEKKGVCKAMLSIWKPNEAITELLTEGAWVEIMNVMPTAFRYSEIQLSAGRQSYFKRLNYKETDEMKTQIESLKRKCYEIKHLTANPGVATDYNEIDTIGMIFLIDPSIAKFESIKNQCFQNVYLTDAEKNILSVNFWGGIKKFGFENILDTGQVISCSNLQRRAGNTGKSIPQYRVTEFTYFTKTPKNETARKMVDELNKILLGIDRRTFFEECVSIKNNYSSTKCLNENISPYRLNNSDYNVSKHKMFIDSPLIAKQDDFNLTGLDFESSFQQSEPLSPKTLERKRKVNEKIAKLKRYGEPPPLSPIHIINRSKSASNSYKSPLCTDSVASNKYLPENSGDQSSPVLQMNRTSVKRSGNPVKLNFSNNDSVDHFAEEFDASPPLSLD